MKIQVLAVGRMKEKYFQEAQAEYLKRLRPYSRVEVQEVRSDESLLSAVDRRDFLIALDETGKQCSSREFAATIADQEMHGAGANLVFAIGGPDGHSQDLRKRANALVSFGRATMAHRLVRLVLLEQIYRAFRINRGEPYHRD